MQHGKLRHKYHKTNYHGHDQSYLDIDILMILFDEDEMGKKVTIFHSDKMTIQLQESL